MAFTMFDKIGEACADLPYEERVAIFGALCDYGFYGKEPGDGLSPLALALFRALAEDIDFSKSKRAAGNKGGRPRKDEDPRFSETENQTQTKVPKTKNQSGTKAEPRFSETENQTQTKVPKTKNQSETQYNTVQDNTSLSSLSPSLGRLKAGDADFDVFCALFDRKPGQKRRETRENFEKLLEEGYTADILRAGAASYLAATPPDERIRFPLTFLQDRGTLRTWCGAPPRALSIDKLTKSTDGTWLYPFKDGPAVVKCPADASREEVFCAVQAMVSAGEQQP